MDSSALPKSSWRFKMEHREKVDAGITFQGGQGYGGSPLYWGQGNTLSQGGSLYVQMFYRRTGTQ